MWFSKNLWITYLHSGLVMIILAASFSVFYWVSVYGGVPILCLTLKRKASANKLQAEKYFI